MDKKIIIYAVIGIGGIIAVYFIVTKITGIFSGIGKFFSNGIGQVSKDAKGLEKQVSNDINTAKSDVAGAVNTVKKDTSQAVKTGVTDIIKVGNNSAKVLKNTAGAIDKGAVTDIHAIEHGTSNAFNTIKKTGSNAVNVIKSNPYVKNLEYNFSHPKVFAGKLQKGAVTDYKAITSGATKVTGAIKSFFGGIKL